MLSKVHYIHLETVDSTNTWAKTHAKELNPTEITCITAEEQTGGRGRWGKKWLSPKGQNLYATLFFCLPAKADYLAHIGQVLAYSCGVVLQHIGLHAQLKWPNDVLVEGKKIAGILCETIDMEKNLGVILGVGLNINMSENLLKTIDQPATSLSVETGKTWNVKEILELLLKQFLIDMNLLREKGFKLFQPAFDKLL